MGTYLCSVTNTKFLLLTSEGVHYDAREGTEPGWVGLVGGVSQSSTSESNESTPSPVNEWKQN